jgi:hypothetical protein
MSLKEQFKQDDDKHEQELFCRLCKYYMLVDLKYSVDRLRFTVEEYILRLKK